MLTIKTYSIIKFGLPCLAKADLNLDHLFNALIKHTGRSQRLRILALECFEFPEDTTGVEDLFNFCRLERLEINQCVRPHHLFNAFWHGTNAPIINLKTFVYVASLKARNKWDESASMTGFIRSCSGLEEIYLSTLVDMNRNTDNFSVQNALGSHDRSLRRLVWVERVEIDEDGVPISLLRMN